MVNKRYDIIIAGGGPAGLLLASKLSPHLSVIVIDKDRIGITFKFWLTNRQRLELHELEGCISCESDKATIGTFLSPSTVAIGNFATVDEFKLLKVIREACKKRGVVFCEQAEISSLSWGKKSIRVDTKKGSFYGRLVIDATGGHSPFASTFGLHRIDGFFSVLGSHLENVEFLAERHVAAAHVMRLGKPAPIFEFIPTGPSSGLAAVFVATKRLLPPEQLENIYHWHILNNQIFSITGKIGRKKLGAIPIGRLKKSSLMEGLISFGESSLIQSPLIGGAFNEVLRYCDSFSKAILSQISRERRRVRVELPIREGLSKKLNDHLQLIIFKSLAHGTIEAFEKMVAFTRHLGGKRAYRLVCGDLSCSDLPRVVIAMRAFSGIKARRHRFEEF